MDIGIPQISSLDYKIDIWNEYSSITVVKKNWFGQKNIEIPVTVSAQSPELPAEEAITI